MEEELKIITEDEVIKIREKMIDEPKLYELSDFFKMFADSSRLKIINVLFNRELCVGDIASILKMSLSAVSHQLKTLKQTRLVKYRKEGKLVYYSLDDEHIKEIFFMGIEHISEF